MPEKDLDAQNKQFIAILRKNQDLMIVLDALEKFQLPNYYVVAGVVFQTIWNYLEDNNLNDNVKDIDIIYYDRQNLAKEDEKKLETKIIKVLKEKGLNYQIDLHNEARMHLWKKEKENKKINQYTSAEDAINKFIVTAHAIGVKKEAEAIKIYAPYGLGDIFSKTLRPIKHEGNDINLYNKKIKKWRQTFNNLTIIDW